MDGEEFLQWHHQSRISAMSVHSQAKTKRCSLFTLTNTKRRLVILSVICAHTKCILRRRFVIISLYTLRHIQRRPQPLVSGWFFIVFDGELLFTLFLRSYYIPLGYRIRIKCSSLCFVTHSLESVSYKNMCNDETNFSYEEIRLMVL